MLLTARVFCISSSQTSLEMKIFGQILPEWAKRLWIKEERGYFLQIEQTHSCHWEGRYIADLVPKSQISQGDDDLT